MLEILVTLGNGGGIGVVTAVASAYVINFIVL